VVFRCRIGDSATVGRFGNPIDAFGLTPLTFEFSIQMSAEVFYDWVSGDELEDAHRIEVIGDVPKFLSLCF